jgi:hypothetical protein
MAATMMGLVTTILGRFIDAYSRFFPVAKGVPVSESETRALARWFFNKAAMEQHYIKAISVSTTTSP